MRPRVFAFLAALGLALTAWQVTSAHAQDEALRARAEQIFAFDRTHPHVLPAHLVRTLSLTIAFDDDEGTRKLVLLLERKMASNQP